MINCVHDLNGPFRSYSCSSDVDYTKLHWILYRNATHKGDEIIASSGRMTLMVLINKIEIRKILRGLNTINVFVFYTRP